jgi:hypothetical protein
MVCGLAQTSRDHLAPHLDLPNRVLAFGMYIVLSRRLWCDFAARSESIGCSGARFPNYRWAHLRVHHSTNL